VAFRPREKDKEKFKKVIFTFSSTLPSLPLLSPFSSFMHFSLSLLPTQIRKNDMAALTKMRSLRQEMERSRTLLEMLKKREKLKKDQLTIVAQVFEQLLVELSVKVNQRNRKKSRGFSEGREGEER
jgi:hypothetical protein